MAQKNHFWGKTWSRFPGRMPFLISAWECAWARWNWRQRIVTVQWVLDYSYTHFGRCRTGSARAAWRNRPAYVAYLYRPGVSHWSDTRSARAPVRTAYLIFQHGETAGLDRLFGSGRSYVCFFDPSNKLGDLMRKTVRAGQEQGPAAFWEAQKFFHEIILLLLRSERQIVRAVKASQDASDRRIQSEEMPAPDGPGLVGKVQAYMREHLGEALRVQDLANHFRMGVSSFAHRYRQESMEPPMQSLTALRVEFAKGLLMRGLPLKAIAESAGFYDIYHLSKTFKRVEGLAPRKYLRTLAR